MKKLSRSVKRVLVSTLLSIMMAGVILAQTAQFTGSVVDPQGAVVPGAQVEVVNANTGQSFKTVSSDRGEWSLPAMQAGKYSVTVTATGFTKVTLQNIIMNAGVPVTANAKLEVGATTETVTVNSAVDVLQTTSATLASTVQTKQVTDLPFISRGGMDLIVTQPGVQTTGTNRSSTINGLPLAALNVTIDGINTQTNVSKDSDGFFSLIPARQDSLQEVTLTTSAGSADTNSQGAATVRFTTKSGTNEYHGGVVWQHRNTAFNANSYFNNINSQPRNRQIINQPAVHVGGPIKKNKLLFFTNLEFFRYPATGSVSRVVMNPSGLSGDYYYPVAGSTTPAKVNVLSLAGAAGFTSTLDPIVNQTLKQIQSYTANGTLQDRIASNSDYNRSNLLFSPKGYSNYWTDTTRLDYNVTDKHTLSLVYTYYKLSGKDDVTNGVWNIFPGTGAIVGLDGLYVSQQGNRYALSATLRSALTTRLTNEFRFGFNRGLSLFRPEVSSSAQFGEWRGYAPTLGYSLTGVASVTGSTRSQAPVRELHDIVSYLKGAHSLSFGGDISKIRYWNQTIGNSVIPGITFGAATNDPIVTGSTNLFTATSMPGSTSTYQAEAAALYSLLTGRVSSISRSVAFDGQSYKALPPTDRNQQYEYGFFAQDNWRVAPSLTVNLGLRAEFQQPFQNVDNAYSAVSYASLWGIGGVGNLFQPNSRSGSTPIFEQYNRNYYSTLKFLNPSVGLAWQLPGMPGFVGAVLGKTPGKSVLRAGYAINSIRDGASIFTSLLGGNKGLNFDTSVSPGGAYAADFGAPGSVLFRQATLPVHTPPNSPAYPLSVTTADSLNGYDPNLKMPYVQSWNVGFQRELSKSTVLEVRYTGNHGVKLWRQVNLNELNTFENGFQKEFYTAQNNLFINRGCSGSPSSPQSWATTNCTNPTSTSFANNGLPGQGAIPIITTALGTTSDSTTANNLRQNRPASIATTYATNATNYGRLINAGYSPTFFQVNPSVSTGGSFLLNNTSSSTYNALQVELNRRLATGLLLQSSYVWSKSLFVGATASSGANSQPTTFRNLGLDKATPGFDVRSTFKINGLYEIPVGLGRRYLSNTPVLRKVLEGWELSSIARVQSGAPFQLTSGRSGLNGNETGVTLNNITLPQLQDMISIQKITPAVTTVGQTPVGQVLWLPPSLVTNTNAAFETNGLSWSNLNASAPYIGPQLAQGQFGYEVFVRQPWQYHFDAAILKRTRITERVNTEFQANFMNILNLTDFFLQNGPSSASFGRTTSAYADLSNNYDPGSRVVEFRLRVNF